MRMLPCETFYAELEKHGFIRTTEKVSDHTLWLHKASKKHYTIPHYADMVPDSILELYLRDAGALYDVSLKPALHTGAKSQYCVTEKNEETPKVVNLRSAEE